MATGSGDFALMMDELRVVARFAVESAQEILPLFEKVGSADPGRAQPSGPQGSS